MSKSKIFPVVLGLAVLAIGWYQYAKYDNEKSIVELQFKNYSSLPGLNSENRHSVEKHIDIGDWSVESWDGKPYITAEAEISYSVGSEEFCKVVKYEGIFTRGFSEVISDCSS